MNLDMCDALARCLFVLGDVELRTFENESGHLNLEVLWKGESFLMLYDDRDEITYYPSVDNDVAHKRLGQLLAFCKKSKSWGLVTDFVLHWNTEMRREYISCSKDMIMLTFLRFFTNGKRKMKTISQVLERRLRKIRRWRQNDRV
ncbi:MAG: hypothetical protein IKS20_12965 [Victivallales bacterium]|nr:hypothetical protein [Victivallales bacterium]